MKAHPTILRLLLFTLLLAASSFLGNAYGQAITGFAPLSIPAGTGAQLTISGSGFGAGPASTVNFVEFPNADNGGQNYIKPALTDYISWADGQIVVKVPSTAGTGLIRVTVGATTVPSAAILTISYNINTTNGRENRHVNTNTIGGYSFQLENGFNAVSDAKNSFRKSLKAWTCLVGVAWSIGAPTAVNVTGKDGTNVIRFDSGAELPAGVLGTTYTFLQSCGSSYWQITEVDMVFNKETNWNFKDTPPTSTQQDFQSCALHELGHALNLDHVIDNTDIMHFSRAPGVARRNFKTSHETAGTFQMNASKVPAGPGCLAPMIPGIPASCSVSFPTIASVTPLTAGQNEKITITGEFFTGATAVSFGGTAASSFTVISDKIIEAIVGTGSNGEISVTTPGGIVGFSGFSMLPSPTISSFSPQSAIAGVEVIISGSNFTEITAVSFGGKAASSFQVLSPTSIRAIVAPGSASGAVSVTNKSGTGTASGFTFNYTLPSNNFSISTTDLTCKGTANGMIKITALTSLNYTATLTGNGTVTNAFTNSLEIKNLQAGPYTLCITVAGESSFSQCFEVTLREPKDLALYSTINQKDNLLSLKLEGAETYYVKLNGELIKTSMNELVLGLKTGTNSLSVSTDKLCQGIIERTFMIGDGVKIFPVPFDNTLNLVLGQDYSDKVRVEIRNMMGKVVYSKEHTPDLGSLSLSLQGLEQGAYLVKVSSEGRRSVQKVLKR